MTSDRRNRDRWGLLTGLDVGADGDPYLDRLRLIQTPLFGLYLHHIHRADREPDPHDHPWSFASIVLTGWYEEFVWPDKVQRALIKPPFCVRRERDRWSLRHIGLRGAHMITDVRGPLWTLVLTGPKRAEWGFWTRGGFTPWREYSYAAEGQPDA